MNIHVEHENSFFYIYLNVEQHRNLWLNESCDLYVISYV